MTALEKRFMKACKVARVQWKPIHEDLLRRRPGGDFGVSAFGEHFNIPQPGDVVVFGTNRNRLLSGHVVHWAMNKQGSISAVWVGVDTRTIQRWNNSDSAPAEAMASPDKQQFVFPIELIKYVRRDGKWAPWKF